jgi:hypothetical protein
MNLILTFRRQRTTDTAIPRETMDEQMKPRSLQAPPDPPQLSSVSSYVVCNVVLKLVEQAEIKAARYFAAKKRYDHLIDPFMRLNDMIQLAHAEERVKARLQDAHNTAAENGLDFETMPGDGEYPS